ncbi:hypothetical protein SK128_006773, partial [Halocaridina rubra]
EYEEKVTHHDAEAAAYSLLPRLTPNITAKRDNSSDVMQLLKSLQKSEQCRLYHNELRWKKNELHSQ